MQAKLVQIQHSFLSRTVAYQVGLSSCPCGCSGEPPWAQVWLHLASWGSGSRYTLSESNLLSIKVGTVVLFKVKMVLWHAITTLWALWARSHQQATMLTPEPLAQPLSDYHARKNVKCELENMAFWEGLKIFRESVAAGESCSELILWKELTDNYEGTIIAHCSYPISILALKFQ